jgi:hypothetical protein
MTFAPTPPDAVDEILRTLEIRAYRPGDEAAILDAFNRVFPWAHRTSAEWNWEFRDNPAGLHCFVAAAPSGRVVAQFTGLPRRMKIGADESRVFAEMVDSLTDPEFRQGLKKPGLFGRCVDAYVKHFGRPDRETVMYGLPNKPAYRIGARLFGYIHLHDVSALSLDVRDATGLPQVAHLGDATCTAVDRVPDDVDELWTRVKREHEVTVVRDRRYLAWRYDAKPKATYRRYAMRDARGKLLAFFVLVDRWIEGEIKKNVTAVVEWVVDRRHPSTKAIAELVPRYAHEAGASEAWFVFRQQSDEWRHCAEVGYLPAPTPFVLVGGTYDETLAPLDRLRAEWFFVLGDFDVA